MDSLRGLPHLKSAQSTVAIGGTAALSSCLGREAETTERVELSFPGGSSDLSTLSGRQFVRGPDFVHAPHGNTVLPQQQSTLFVNYTGSEMQVRDEWETATSRHRGLFSFLDIVGQTMYQLQPSCPSARPAPGPGEAG